MKKILFVLACISFVAQSVHSQAVSSCFEISSILVDACPSDEGLNEQVTFQVGPNALNTSNLQVVWPNSSNSWSGVCQSPETAAKVLAMNATINSCGFLREPINGVLPANSKVLLFSSIQADVSALSFPGLTDTLYVIFHCGANTAGNFANFGTGLRTLEMSFNNVVGCTDQVTYDRALLVNQSNQPAAEDGSIVRFAFDGTPTYTFGGCNPGSIPVVATFSAPASVCSNSAPIDLNTLVTGTPGGTFSGAGVSNNIFNPSLVTGNSVISYSFGSGGCLVQTQQNIIVNQGGDPSWTSPGALCGQTDPILLTNWITGTTGGTWTGAGVATPLFFPSSVNGAVSITYTVGQGNCQSSLTQSVTITNVLAGPPVSNTNFCNTATTATITANAVPNATVNWYSNSALTNLIGTGTTYSPTFGVNTTIYVTQTVPGCNVGSAAVAVNFIDPPAPPVTDTNIDFCAGTPLPQLTATATATIFWYNDQALSQLLGTGTTLQPVESQAPDIWVVAGSANCRSTPVQVNLNSLVLNPAWDAPSVVCSDNAPIDLTTLVTGTAGGTWSGNGVSGSSFNPAGLNGNVVISYTIGSGDCSAQDQQAILVLSGGDPSWTSPGTLCNQTEPINLNDWVTGTPGGTWSGTAVAGVLFFPEGVNGPATLTYSVGAGQCADVSTQVFNVQSSVNAPSVNDTTTFCDGETPTPIDANVLNGATVSWYSDAALTNLVFTGNGFVPSSTVNATYYVTQGFPGCTSPATPVEISFAAAPPVPDTDESIEYCPGESIPLLTATGNGTITWFNDDGLTEILGVGNSYQPTNSDAPDVFVQVSVGNCRSPFVKVTINETPLVEAKIINTAPLETCDFVPVELSTDAGSGIQWSTGQTSQTITISSAGLYTLIVNGACNSDTATIEFIDNGVTANFTVNAESGIAPFSLIATDASVNADNTVFYLDGVAGGITSGSPLSLEEGEYTIELVATNNEGCTSSLTRTITVISGEVEVSIPNSFTPNGDGFNDAFSPTIKGMAELSFVIFNRWGNEVVSFNSDAVKWDGTTSSKASPDGVYFYVLRGTDVYGASVERSGSITVVRD